MLTQSYHKERLIGRGYKEKEITGKRLSGVKKKSQAPLIVVIMYRAGESLKETASLVLLFLAQQDCGDELAEVAILSES